MVNARYDQRMSIDRAFAINATQAEIWDALWQDLTTGDANAFTVERSNRPNSFTLRLDLGGLPSILKYSIEPRDDYCEVTASIEPLSARYRLLQILTFGRARLNYEVLLTQSLASLKSALEGDNDGEPLVETETLDY